ncbi:MAG: VCBS repeat-containing protein, partial [Candidatus Delongbacteria bacterium]|nr:VCBS repeat-containing protein [Candidatus Delongbacteria bacterium]
MKKVLIVMLISLTNFIFSQDFPILKGEHCQVSFITNGQSIQATNSWDIKLVDINRDGNLDAYFGNKTWLNNGNGNLSETNLSLGNSNSAAIALGDINKDGKTDAVIVNVKLDAKNSYASAPYPVEIWLNKAFESNYLNETEPGDMPVLFGKDIVSVEGKNTHACTFSP